MSTCTQSIRSQTYKDFKCILLDDGSTDSSGAICDEYAKKDSRIQVIHQLNKGIADTRNIGLQLEESELISFIDGDDTVDFTMYEKLVSYLDKYNCDAVMCDFKANIEYDRTLPTEGMLDVREHTQQILNNQVQSHLWKYLFKTKLWQGIRFPTGRRI